MRKVYEDILRSSEDVTLVCIASYYFQFQIIDLQFSDDVAL